VQNSGGAVDRIRPLAVLGEGRHGQVFVGIDAVLRRRVVIKRVFSGSFENEETRQELINEARVLSCIDHPNLLRIYNYSEEDGDDVFTIEYVEGQRLPAVLADGLDFGKKVQIATAVASALTVAHRNGVVHGAVSPDSVSISPRGVIKLVDFNSTSNRVDGSRTDDRWLSPEETRGEKPVRESDMYRFGLLLLELFGTRDRDVRALIAALVHEAPTDRLTAADAHERLQVLAHRTARRLRIAAFALLGAIFVCGGIKYTLDLRRERAAAVAAQARAEAVRAGANALVAFMIEDLRPKLLSVGKLEIMDATSNKAFAYFASIDPARISAREAAANVRALAQFSEAQLLRNDVRTAEEAAVKAIAIADAALRKYPDDLEILFARATAHSSCAGALIRKGDLLPAFRHANAFAAACSDLVRRKPDDVRFVRNQANAFSILGALYDSTGDIDASFRNYDMAVTILRPLAERDGSDESRAELFNDGRFASTALIKLGRFAEARQRMESARAGIADIGAQASNKELLDIRAGYDDQLVSLALATGDLDAARLYADAQLATSRQLVAFDPARFRWTRLLVMAQRSAGTIARMNGDVEAALHHHNEAIETASALLARGSAPNTLPRENACTRVELARSLLAAHRPAQALLHTGLAVEVLSAMPADVTARQFLADALLVRGEALEAEGKQAAARDAWVEAVRIVESLPSHPPDPRAVDTQARAWLRLGRLDRATPLIEQLSAIHYRNREFEALGREKGAIHP